jgi:hypothetical protein
MENNKYFTPDIEDIHAGYECELLIYAKWEPNTVKPYTALESVGKCIKDKVIRVPYLTKEQIEAEGWELIQIYPKGACIFQKGTKEKGCELTCDFTEHRVHFTKLYFYGLDDEYTRTKLTWSSLECKDINTFRKIIKLLGI